MYLVIPSKKKLKVMGLTYNALPPGRRGCELKKIMTLEARFQNLGEGVGDGGGGGLLSGGAEFSEGQGELNYQKELDSRGLP